MSIWAWGFRILSRNGNLGDEVPPATALWSVTCLPAPRVALCKRTFLGVWGTLGFEILS